MQVMCFCWIRMKKKNTVLIICLTRNMDFFYILQAILISKTSELTEVMINFMKINSSSIVPLILLNKRTLTKIKRNDHGDNCNLKNVANTQYKKNIVYKLGLLGPMLVVCI